MKRFVFAATLLLAALPLMATTVVFVPNDKAIRLSELILVGRVVNVETTYDKQGQIVRNVSLSVSETMKGKIKPGEIFTFQAWGGVKDGVRDEALGEAKYRAGEKVLVQLEKIDGVYHTLGLSFGKWNLIKDKSGRELLRRDLSELMGVKQEKFEVPVEMELKHMREQVQKVERERIVR